MLKWFRVLTLAALATSCVWASPESDAQHQIEGAYARQDAASVHKDVAGIEAIDAPDCAFVKKDGTLDDKAQRHAQMTNIMAHCSSVVDRTKVTGFKLIKGHGYAEVAEHLELNLTSEDGRKAKLVYDTTSSDIWVPGKSGWVRQTTQQRTEHTTMDGKEVGK